MTGPSGLDKEAGQDRALCRPRRQWTGIHLPALVHSYAFKLPLGLSRRSHWWLGCRQPGAGAESRGDEQSLYSGQVPLWRMAPLGAHSFSRGKSG